MLKTFPNSSTSKSLTLHTNSNPMPRTSKKSRNQGAKGKQVRRATVQPSLGPIHVMSLLVDVFLEVCPDLVLIERKLTRSADCGTL